MKLRVDASIEKATPLLERFAVLAGDLAAVEGNRDAALARTNAVADELAKPILTEMADIRAQLEPWWKRAGAALLQGKRKSIELGGCVIGTRAAKAKLLVPGDDKAAVALLEPLAWAKKLIRRTPALDKAGIAAALTGKRADELKALGFSMSEPGETFVLERVAQEGTLASLGS